MDELVRFTQIVAYYSRSKIRLGIPKKKFLLTNHGTFCHQVTLNGFPQVFGKELQ